VLFTELAIRTVATLAAALCIWPPVGAVYLGSAQVLFLSLPNRVARPHAITALSVLALFRDADHWLL
jgi:hypothetical protein